MLENGGNTYLLNNILYPHVIALHVFLTSLCSVLHTCSEVKLKKGNHHIGPNFTWTVLVILQPLHVSQLITRLTVK